LRLSSGKMRRDGRGFVPSSRGEIDQESLAHRKTQRYCCLLRQAAGPPVMRTGNRATGVRVSSDWPSGDKLQRGAAIIPCCPTTRRKFSLPFLVSSAGCAPPLLEIWKLSRPVPENGWDIDPRNGPDSVSTGNADPLAVGGDIGHRVSSKDFFQERETALSRPGDRQNPQVITRLRIDAAKQAESVHRRTNRFGALV